MATIQKRDGKYRAIVRKNGVTKSKTFTLKKSAEAWARQCEIDIENGTIQDADSHALVVCCSSACPYCRRDLRARALLGLP